LPRDVAQSVACAIIGSRLDYCNSLYYGIANTIFQRLQRVHEYHIIVLFTVPTILLTKNPGPMKNFPGSVRRLD